MATHVELLKETISEKELMPISPAESSMVGTHVDLFQDSFQRPAPYDEPPRSPPDRGWERLQMQLADLQGQFESQRDASARRDWRTSAELEAVKAQIAAIRGDFASQRDVAMRLEVQVGLLAGQLSRIEAVLTAAGPRSALPPSGTLPAAGHQPAPQVHVAPQVAASGTSP